MKAILSLLCCMLYIACTPQAVSKKKTSAAAAFRLPKGITFPVSDVALADTLLHTDLAKHVFENKIGKEILYFPTQHQNYRLAPCINNGLIQAVQECYGSHRPLVLTPDVFWLTICQGASIHINENYSLLEEKIFKAGKPDKLTVRNDKLAQDKKEWGRLIESLTAESRKYTREDMYTFFVPEFSTTSPEIKTAYQICMLESYSKAFQYVGESGCGIPSVHIAGSVEDWQAMKGRLPLLAKLGLDDWRIELVPILDQCIAAAAGKPDTKFWQDIYKEASEYNAVYLSGWIIKLFPYITELQWAKPEYDSVRQEYLVNKKYKRNPYLSGIKYLSSTLATDNFPSGISKIGIVWNNYFDGTTAEMEAYSGFFALKQYPDKSLEPLISWALCRQDAQTAAHSLKENRYRAVKHSESYWSPHFVEDIRDTAFYSRKQFKYATQSHQFVKQAIAEALAANGGRPQLSLARDTIEIDVMLNGEIGSLRIKAQQDSALKLDIARKTIAGLPEKWFPALAHPTDALNLMDPSEEEEKIKVRVNSTVKLGW